MKHCCKPENVDSHREGPGMGSPVQLQRGTAIALIVILNQFPEVQGKNVCLNPSSRVLRQPLQANANHLLP